MEEKRADGGADGVAAGAGAAYRGEVEGGRVPDAAG